MKRENAMPLMTICKYPGCFNRVPYGTRFCAAHSEVGEKREIEAKAKRDAARLNRLGSASERGYSYRWRCVAKHFLQKHPICAECERRGVIRMATCVDHITPHRGDRALFWDSSNWQSLCQECHSRKTAAEDGGFGNRIRKGEGG